MPLAGQTIKALDFAGYAATSSSTDETNFNSTTFTLGGSTTGVSFIAPTSGIVLVTFGGRIRLNSTTAVHVLLAAEVRTGSSIGSGTVIHAAADAWSLNIGEQSANNRLSASKIIPVSGLTAGSTYNVSLWHRNSTSVASAGSIFDREVTVVGVFN